MYHDPSTPQEEPAARRGRKPAFSRDEIRDRMLAAGLDLLEQRGVEVSLTALRFDEVAAMSSVPRASAYRAWESDEHGQQASFRLAIASKLLEEQIGFGTEPGGAFDSTMNAVADFLSSMPPMEETAATERFGWLQEAMRLGGNANQRAVDRSVFFSCYVAIAASVATNPEQTPPELAEAWERGEAAASQRYVDFYRAMAVLFGFRLREEYRWEHFGSVTAALAEGISLRIGVNPWLDRIGRPTPHQSDETGWSLYAIGFEALVRQFFEPDPAWSDPTVFTT